MVEFRNNIDALYYKCINEFISKGRVEVSEPTAPAAFFHTRPINYWEDEFIGSDVISHYTQITMAG